MSIFFDFKVGPLGRTFRRAVDGDRGDISKFLDSESEKLFGRTDIGELIELSTLAICMINANKEVLGFLALDDHPNIPSVDPADWETWIRNLFQRYYLSRNTLFIHYMCCADSMLEYFLDEALVSVFDNDRYLRHIVLVVPTKCPEDILIHKHPVMKRRNVYKYYAKHQEELEPERHIYTFIRHDFCPKLKMRRAVEEDNDDIIEILDKTCPRLKNLYGDYYISELIGRHPESQRKIIVAEHQDRAVGVMCLNEDVNYRLLAETYELRPYYGLRKATPIERERGKRANSLLTTFGQPILTGEWSPFQFNVKLENLLHEAPSIDDMMAAQQRTKKNSRVNFGNPMRKSLDHIINRAQNQSDDYSDKIMYVMSPTQSRGTTYSISELLDADPFDYEIVNIDYELLNVPEVSVYSTLKPSSTYKKDESIKRGPQQSVGKKHFKEEDSSSFDYGGEPNAFKIELLGLRDEFNDRHLFELLEGAFEIMQKYDYCIIRAPFEDKTFCLLNHFCFVPTRPAVCSEHALYIAHRSAVMGKLRVKEAELVDIPQIADLLCTLEGRETLWTVENTIHSRDQHRAFVFFSGASVVGVGVLEPPEQIDFIRAKFNIDMFHNHKYHYRGQGSTAGFRTIKVAQVYSVFEVHYRFFVREMMRLSGATTLLWLTAYRNKWETHKANSLTAAMIPLLPRKSEIDCTVVHELRNFGNISQKITAFSTWYMGKKFTSITKADINTRIVVIGASRTAMSFLNTLLFTDTASYLNFTSVTLVSPDGLPYIRHSKHTAEMMFPKYRTNTDKFLKSVPYTYYVNVIQGTMVDINRKDRYIILRNGGKCYYDMLFLLLGKQYQHPNYLKDIYEKERLKEYGIIPPYVRLDVPRGSTETPITTEAVPPNVFIVNTMAMASKAINYVKSLSWTDLFKDKVIVYGSSIHAYCCLAALLEARVPPEAIVFVDPFPPESRHKLRVPVFYNVNVDQTINDVLTNMKLTVYRSYRFQSWSCDARGVASHVDFLSYFQALRLDCAALFYYGMRGINAAALNAINNSGLVYDGGILIDHEFRTKDPYIYAAGPATRYHRRYFADSFRQKYYDALEIGEKLGNQIRNQLDPFFCKTKRNVRKNSVRFSILRDLSPGSQRFSGQSTKSMLNSEEGRTEMLPVLKKPVMIHCCLPGNLRYLEVRSPGLKLPNYYVQTLEYSGHVMETFKRGYFKIHLNNHFVVDGITCLSTEKYSLENFQYLYGLPTNVLNNVYLRYTAKKLDDFYEFFRSPWAFFLYHDQCDHLFAMAKEILPKGQKTGATLEEALRDLSDKVLSDPSVRFDTKLRVRSKFEHAAHIEAITDYVIEWLSENDVLLPMYIYPAQLLYFHQDLEINPIFKKRRTQIAKMWMKMLF